MSDAAVVGRRLYGPVSRPVDGRIATLASSSDSEVDGAPSSTVCTPPPAKKLRLCAAMQQPSPTLSSDRNPGSRRSSEQLSAVAADAAQVNGADAHLNGCDEPAACEPSPAVKLMSRTDKDIIRLIGQHLQAIGLTYDLLIDEYVRFRTSGRIRFDNSGFRFGFFRFSESVHSVHESESGFVNPANPVLTLIH